MPVGDPVAGLLVLRFSFSSPPLFVVVVALALALILVGVIVCDADPVTFFLTTHSISFTTLPTHHH